MGFIMGLSSYNIHVVANEYYVGLAWRYQPAEMSYNNWWQKKRWLHNLDNCETASDVPEKSAWCIATSSNITWKLASAMKRWDIQLFAAGMLGCKVFVSNYFVKKSFLYKFFYLRHLLIGTRAFSQNNL